MFSSFIKRPFLVVIILSTFGLLLGFQNCSPTTSSFTAVGEIGESSNFEAPITRNLQVSPEKDLIINEQPVKVLLVVDNSGTMEQSQDNLARSIQQLSTLLENFDAEIRVVDTTCTNCLESLPTDIQTTTETRTTTSARRFLPTFKKFKLEKTATLSQKQTVLTQLSTHIKSLGTNGSNNEAPLRSIALGLEDETFFKLGDNALIYVITDENDVMSANYGLSAFEKSRVKIESLPRTVMDPYFTVEGYTYHRRWYIGRWQEYAGESCGYDDQGRPTGCSPSYNSQSRDYNTQSACLSDVSQYLGGNCNQADYNPKERTYGQSIADLCAQARANYPQQILSCGATSWTEGGPRTIPGSVLSEKPTYFLNLDQHNSKLHVAIKERLQALFGSNYLLAAQVNTEAQSCTLGDGQTIDTAFKQFENILPKGRLFRSSICEASAVSGDILREITTRFSENTKNLYRVELDESERILGVSAIKGETRVTLVENVNYKFSNNTLSLINLDPSDFDYLDVGVGKKMNWGK